MMSLKKCLLGIGILGLFAVGALPALSDSDNAAEITRDFGCSVYDGNGNLTLADGSIEIDNNGGNTVLVCKASGVANDTGGAVRFDETSPGKACNTFAGPSDNWFNQVSASGNVTLSCRVSD